MVGDTFEWTVTYDDTSLRMHQYNDGVNGEGDFGGIANRKGDRLNHPGFHRVIVKQQPALFHSQLVIDS